MNYKQQIYRAAKIGGAIGGPIAAVAVGYCLYHAGDQLNDLLGIANEYARHGIKAALIGYLGGGSALFGVSLGGSIGAHIQAKKLFGPNARRALENIVKEEEQKLEEKKNEQ